MTQTAQQRYEYFNAKGTLIGQSTGFEPDTQLLDQAHYAVQNSDKMIKNQDSKFTIKSDIESFRKELIQTPVSNMTDILHLNQIISALSDYLKQEHEYNEECFSNTKMAS